MQHIEHVFPPEMSEIRESQLIRALSVCAGTYYDFNVTKNCVIGTAIREKKDGRIQAVNELIGLPEHGAFTDMIAFWGSHLAPRQQPGFLAFFDRANLEAAFARGETHLVHTFFNDEKGNAVPAEQHVLLYRDITTGDLLGLTFSTNRLFVEELIQREKEARLLADRSNRDALTDLPNRNQCETELAKPMRSAEQDAENDRTAVMMVDLDGLKNINDTLGHHMGDTMIQTFGRLLREAVPEKHFVGRYGGDEFIIVAHGLGNRAEAEAVIDALELRIAYHNTVSADLPIRFSAGFAMTGDIGGSTLKALLIQADRNMYEAKHMHKVGIDRLEPSRS